MNLKREPGGSDLTVFIQCEIFKGGEASLKLFINLNNPFKIFMKFNNLNIHTASRDSINIIAYVVLFIN